MGKRRGNSPASLLRNLSFSRWLKTWLARFTALFPMPQRSAHVLSYKKGSHPVVCQPKLCNLSMSGKRNMEGNQDLMAWSSAGSVSIIPAPDRLGSMNAPHWTTAINGPEATSLDLKSVHLPGPCCLIPFASA